MVKFKLSEFGMLVVLYLSPTRPTHFNIAEGAGSIRAKDLSTMRDLLVVTTPYRRIGSKHPGKRPLDNPTANARLLVTIANGSTRS